MGGGVEVGQVRAEAFSELRRRKLWVAAADGGVEVGQVKDGRPVGDGEGGWLATAKAAGRPLEPGRQWALGVEGGRLRMTWQS